MAKVVYVTGCLGFIGSYVTNACLEKGWYVIGVDKMTYASNKKLVQIWEEKYQNRFLFVQKDINDLEFLYECDYIINTAAETHVGNSITNSDEFVHSNINGVHHLLELVRYYRQETSKVPILIHFSTDEVYGDIEKGAHTESHLLRPSNPYSATKAAADMLVLAWARTYNLPYVIVRPTNNYGIGQYVEKLIPKCCRYLKLGKKIPLHNNGTPIRNWLHASDTASAVITIIESQVENEIYNIAGGFEQSNYETVRKVISSYYSDLDYADLLPIDSYLDLSYSRVGQDVRYALDDSKLRALGWKPEAIFDEKLQDITNYYKNKFIW
jgi:dTDP-glucose 4,6-dehydratase